MVEFYLKRIEKGIITLQDVPLKWRSEVAERI
jgi:hypothetical protein